MVPRSQTGFYPVASEQFGSGLLAWKQQLLVLCILQQQMDFPFRGFLNEVHASRVKVEKVRWNGALASFPCGTFTSEVVRLRIYLWFLPEHVRSIRKELFLLFLILYFYSNGWPLLFCLSSNRKTQGHQEGTDTARDARTRWQRCPAAAGLPTRGRIPAVPSTKPAAAKGFRFTSSSVT